MEGNKISGELIFLLCISPYDKRFGQLPDMDPHVLLAMDVKFRLGIQ